MSDKFEQWMRENHPNFSPTLLEVWNAALSSLQGEAVGEAFNGRCFLYDANPVKNLHIENGAKLFTYPPDASAKIAELEAKLAEVEKDAERYQAIKKNVEEVLVSPRTTHLDEYGLVDIRMKWQIKPTLISYTCVGENISFDEASDMLVAAIQESKKGGA